MIEVKLTTKQAEDLESYIDLHMYFCSCELNGLEEELPEDWEPFGPYCGCQTCETREYLMAATSWLRNNNLVDIYVENSKDMDENEITLFD